MYHDKSKADEPPRTPINVMHRKNRHETHIDELPCPHIMGGYDGGVELGFDGKWPDKTFDRVIATLEAGRSAAQQKHNDARFITLGGRQFLVQPYGGGKGVNYRYIIEGDGVKFCFHHKPDGGIQPIRLRYGFESLIGCNLFRVHDDTRQWLNRIGFVVEKETLSRVDLQVMIHHETSELLRPIANGHVVTKALKWSNHGKGNNAETFKIGGQRKGVASRLPSASMIRSALLRLFVDASMFTGKHQRASRAGQRPTSGSSTGVQRPTAARSNTGL